MFFTHQFDLLDSFETAGPTNAVYCHQQVLEKLYEQRQDGIGKRDSLLMQRQPKLEAICREGMSNFRAAAESYEKTRSLKEALQCYRAISDFPAALELVKQLSDCPATESLEWIGKLQNLIGEPPDKFNKVVTPAEKKLLQELLEQSLGMTRRKAATKQVAVKKAVAKRAVVKTSPARTEIREW
jgi:hypothetical protein